MGVCRSIRMGLMAIGIGLLVACQIEDNPQKETDRVAIASLKDIAEGLRACINEAGWLYVDQVVELACSDLNNLEGIEYFSGTLSRLSLNSEALTEIDLSELSRLESLRVGAPVEELNLSNNRELKGLYIYSSQMNSIDLSNSAQLESLHLFSELLVTLDLSAALSLEVLELGWTSIQEIDVSHLRLLRLLMTPETVVTLNISNTDITELWASSQSLKVFTARNSSLETLSLSSPILESIDIEGSFGLTSLALESEVLPTVDLSTLTALTSLTMGEVETLNLFANTALEDLTLLNPRGGVTFFEGNDIERLNIIGCDNGIPDNLLALEQLKHLTLSRCMMERFDSPDHASLQFISFHESHIQTVDLSLSRHLFGFSFYFSVVKALLFPESGEIETLVLTGSSMNCESLGSVSFECVDGAI